MNNQDKDKKILIRPRPPVYDPANKEPIPDKRLEGSYPIKNNPRYYINNYNPYSNTKRAHSFYNCIVEMEAIYEADKQCENISYDEQTELMLKAMEPYFKEFCTPLESAVSSAQFRQVRKVQKRVIEESEKLQALEKAQRVVDQEIQDINKEVKKEPEKTFFQQFCDFLINEDFGSLSPQIQLKIIINVLLYIFGFIFIYFCFRNDPKTSLKTELLRYHVGFILCLFIPILIGRFS
jgi:hypothetical protein